MSKCLQKYHKKNVIILIDEYDVPLENAYFEGFYDKMISFVRSLFESVLKTNTALEFAIITGCLRISRESVFTDLNNLEVISVLNCEYSEYFGFTLPEIRGIMHYYGLDGKEQELKEWYESGNGRPDIVMQAASVRGKAFVFELKVAGDFQQMQKKCRDAVMQAVREDYGAELKRAGYSDITIYGVCFYRKECLVQKA